jgi:hypothetical protein
MPAVSKAQQRFMGMVHAADKGETPASPEVAKVSADMKDSDAKDFASTKHDGLPDHVKEQLKSVVREVIREKNGMNEMSSNDVHFKHIMKLYDRGGSFTKKKVGAVVCKDPKASRKDVEEELLDADYRDIIEFEDELGLTEIREKYNSVKEDASELPQATIPAAVKAKLQLAIDKIKDSKLSNNAKLQLLAQVIDAIGIDKSQLSTIASKIRSKMESVVTEEFKHVIHVDTPTQVVSKPVAAQIMALAKKGVRASEIGLEMGFVGNAKLAADTFQKVKNKIYFELDKRNESVNEAKFKSPDYIISTTPASSLPQQKLGHADVSVGLKMAEKLKNYTLDVRHYNLIHANGKVALKLTQQGKTAVRVRTEDDPKYLQLIQKTVNDVVADYVSKLKESVNEGLSKDSIVRTLTSDKGAYFLTKDGNGWILDITPKGAQNSTFHQKFDVKDLGKGHLGMKYKLSESVNEALDPKAEKFLDAIQVNDRSIKDLKNITVDATPQGNWSVYYKGKRMFTLNGKMLDDKTIMKYGLEHMDESLSEGKKIQRPVKFKSVNEEHDCGCNENHDCGCGGLHEHHINEDLSADANGIAGLTASRASAVKDFLEKNNINSNKLYLFLKKGNLKDRMDFVTALVGKPGNPIQKKVISQFSN